MVRTVAIWDIDGTLANHDHRSVFLEKTCNMCLYKPMPVGHHVGCPMCGSTSSTASQESWDKFLDPNAMLKDTPIPAALSVLERLRSMSAEIHYITGRRRETHEATEMWLNNNVGKTPSETLNMRELEDNGMPASNYKSRAIDRLKSRIGSEGVFLFFEDDPHVFSVYNKHGLVVRCPDGLEHFMPKGPSRPEEPWNI